MDDDDVNDDGKGGAVDFEAQAAESKAKLAEFRNNNRKLHKSNEEMKAQLAEMKAQLDGLDLSEIEEAKEALEFVRSTKDKEYLEKGEIDKVVEGRMSAAKREHEKALLAQKKVAETAMQETAALRSKLNAVFLDKAASEAVDAVGSIQKGAVSDVLSRARATFQVDAEGELVARDSAGEVVYGPSGNPLTMQEFAAQLLEEAPHLFIPSKGAGASGNQTPGAGTKRVREIDGSDPLEFAKYAKEIKEGKVMVRMD